MALLVILSPVRAQPGRITTPRPWVKGAEPPRPGPFLERVLERVLFSRKDLLPPPHGDTLEVRGIETSVKGLITGSRLYEVDHPGRDVTLLLDAPGEILSFMGVKDFNSDNVRELVVALSPPKDPARKRLVVFAYNTRDGKYVRTFENPQVAGLKLRYIPIESDAVNDPERREYALALDEPAPGATESFRTKHYRYLAEKWELLKTIKPRPVTPGDQIAWAQESLGQGDFLSARELASEATASQKAELRSRAHLLEAKAALALGEIPRARRCLETLAAETVTVTGQSVLLEEVKRYQELLSRAVDGKDGLPELVQAESALDGDRIDQALTLAREFRTAWPRSNLIDHILMVEARALIARGQDRDAIVPLSRIVMEFPQSPHFRRAQGWVVSLEESLPPPSPGPPTPPGSPPLSPGRD